MLSLPFAPGTVQRNDTESTAPYGELERSDTFAGTPQAVRGFKSLIDDGPERAYAPDVSGPFPLKVLTLVILYVPVDDEWRSIIAVSGVCRMWRYFANYAPHWTLYQPGWCYIQQEYENAGDDGAVFSIRTRDVVMQKQKKVSASYMEQRVLEKRMWRWTAVFYWTIIGLAALSLALIVVVAANLQSCCVPDCAAGSDFRNGMLEYLRTHRDAFGGVCPTTCGTCSLWSGVAKNRDRMQVGCKDNTLTPHTVALGFSGALPMATVVPVVIGLCCFIEFRGVKWFGISMWLINLMAVIPAVVLHYNLVHSPVEASPATYCHRKSERAQKCAARAVPCTGWSHARKLTWLGSMEAEAVGLLYAFYSLEAVLGLLLCVNLLFVPSLKHRHAILENLLYQQRWGLDDDDDN